MIGLDTNVVVRYLAQDDPPQSRAASRLIDGLSEHDLGFVSIVTVVETFWVLRRAYQVPDVEVRRLLRGLVDSAELLVQHADEVNGPWTGPATSPTDWWPSSARPQVVNTPRRSTGKLPRRLGCAC